MRRDICRAGRNEPSPSFDDEKNLPGDLLTPAVDGILSRPSSHKEIFGRLQEATRSHYGKKTYPERADMQTARIVRNAGQVVMKALADAKLASRFASMETPEDLLLPYDIPGVSLYAEGAGHRQTGEYDRFMQIMTAHYLGATAAFFYSQNEDSEYGWLWETLKEQEQEFHDTWVEYRRAAEKRGARKLDPPFEPFGDLENAIVGGIGNNMLTIQNELLSCQRYFDSRWKPDSGEPYARFMSRMALTHAGLLMLPATTNRQVVSEILPDPTLSEDGAMVCEDPLNHTAKPNNLVAGKGGVIRWAHPSLEDGRPWRLRGKCVGDVPHIPVPGSENAIDTCFKRMSKYAGGAKIGRENGLYSIQLAHGLGALVAELTMYKKDKSMVGAVGIEPTTKWL